MELPNYLRGLPAWSRHISNLKAPTIDARRTTKAALIPILGTRKAAQVNMK